MELTTKERIKMLAGKGMWHNEDLDGKVPSALLSDGPHGLRRQNEVNRGWHDSIPATCYPTASALACSWDLDAIGDMAESLGIEAWNNGVSVVLGPGTNMKRSPLCGRNFEYFSEDPYLAGQIATKFVNTVQRQGVGTSLKHFAANSQETERLVDNSVVDERTLREIYLTAFEETVKKAQPATVMASYNMINGTHSTENDYLLNKILREEWGFKGLVVSDWAACSDLTKSVPAGVDLDMPGTSGYHQEKCIKDYENGKISEEDIVRASDRVLALITKYEPKNRKHIQHDYHKTALDVAKKCAVLLKNEGMLPLENAKTVTVIGEMARNVRFQGGGSSHINVPHYKNILDAFKEKGIKCEFAKGYSIEDPEFDIRLEMEAEDLAKTAAEEGRPVLFFGGLTDGTESEGFDRRDLSMPANQVRLFNKLSGINKNMIYVSFSGSPYTMPFADKTKAILQMYLCGEASGEAAVSILTGETNPSGKLAETFPVKIEDTPAFENFGTKDKNVEYKEGVFIGYRHYDTKNIPVEYPFGYGLSYTNFEYEDIELKRGEKPLEFIVSFKVKNIGKRAGYETAEVYVENPHEGRPVKELRGFTKLYLEPGETKQAEVKLTARSFSFYDVTRKTFAVPEGVYKVLVGASSRDIRLSKEVNVSRLDTEGCELPVITKEEYAASVEKKVYIRADGTEGDPYFTYGETGPYTMSSSLNELSTESRLARTLIKKEVERILKEQGVESEDDPKVRGIIDGMMSTTIDSVANYSGGRISFETCENIVKQANKKLDKETK